MCSKQKASQKAEDTHKYESMMEVNLVDCTVSGNLDAEEQKKMKIKENLDLYFKLTTVKKTYYWKTESSLQRKQWVDEFQKAIQSMKTKT